MLLPNLPDYGWAGHARKGLAGYRVAGGYDRGVLWPSGVRSEFIRLACRHGKGWARSRLAAVPRRVGCVVPVSSARTGYKFSG